MQNSLGKKTLQGALKYQYLSVNKCQVLYRKPIFLERKAFRQEWGSCGPRTKMIYLYAQSRLVLVVTLCASGYTWTPVWGCLGDIPCEPTNQLPRDAVTTESQTLLLMQLKSWPLKTKYHFLSFKKKSYLDEWLTMIYFNWNELFESCLWITYSGHH